MMGKRKSVTISPELIDRVRKDINGALAEVGERHGLHLRAGRASYTDEAFTMTVDGCRAGAGTKEQRCFKRMAAALGISSAALGAELTIAGKSFVVLGMKPHSAKIICEHDGARYLIDARLVAEQYPLRPT
jgi:hypothetical protein